MRWGLRCIVAALLLFATSPATRAETLSVGVGGRTLFAYLPLTLADRLGYFRDEGLTVEINDFQGGPKSLEALIGGSVEMVTGAYENTLFMQAKGIDLTTVVLFQDRFGFVFGLSKEQAARYKSPADLKGLKIGVTAPGSAQSNALDIILAKGGLTNADVAIIGVGGGPGAVAAMESGRIDGIMSSDPVITRLVLDKAIVPIVDSRKEDGQVYLYNGPCASSGSYTTARIARERRPAVQGFANAMVRALKWMQTASVDEIVAAVPPGYYGQDKDAYRQSLAENLPTFTKDGRITRASAANTYKAVSASGRLAGASPLDIDKTFDASFADVANRK